jgi:hypothetical protein
MNTQSSTQATLLPKEEVALVRLWWVAPLTILAAVVANLLIRQVAVAILRPDPRFVPLTIAAPVSFTLFGLLGAVIVYALVARFSRRPITLFTRIAMVTLLVTFIPDILMAVTGFNPGTTIPNVIVLMLMHLSAWAICVNMLTRLTRKS